MIKILREKYEIRLKSHVKIRNTIKITCENTKYD